jgi:kumamolisin
MPDTHIELPGSRRPLATGASRVRDIDPQSHVEVTVTLKAPPLPSADAMPEESLTSEQFTERYGAAPADIRKVEDVLRSYGLHVEPSDSARSLRVSGTAAAVQEAFGARLGVYQSATQGEFRGREGTLQIPKELEGLITGVFGLDQRRVARRKAMAGTIAAKVGVALRPADLETHYSFPPGDCAGQSIAIAEFGAPLTNGAVLPPAYFPDDTTAFCEAQGRPVPTVKTVSVNITPLTLAQLRTLPTKVANAVAEESMEVMMDVEIIAALCSKASISVYYASFDEKGWVDLLDQVIAARPVALSVSYGLAEDSPDWSAGALKAINERLQATAMVGITVCVSSGDDGSGCDQPGTRVHVEFPGSSPFVLSVGGTMMQDIGGVTEEVVWWQSPGRRTGNGHSGATGGGVSALFARPSWQTVKVPSLNPGSIDGRVVPDVAALAGPPLYELTFLGHSSPNGGTSASAPLWASLIARINAALPKSKQQRFLSPLLYRPAAGGGTIGAAGCTDIMSGNNTTHPLPGHGYAAGKGFDAVTGWGVPSGNALLKALS